MAERLGDQIVIGGFVRSAALAAISLFPAIAIAQQPAGIPVTVTPALKRDVPILLGNIGAVQPFYSALIRVRVDGTLQEVYFQEGQEVKKGDRLALIDPGPYKAAYDQAVAKKAADMALVESAKRDYARAADLNKRQFETQQVVDQKLAVVNQLAANLQGDDAVIAAAKVNLDYTNITAPFDGVMGIRMADPGNVIRAADPAGAGIVTINQIHPVAVTFTLPQDTLPAIQAAMAKAAPSGGKLIVFASSADGKTRLGKGSLITTDNAIDPTTGTIKLKASFPNTDSRLWPGQFVNMKLETDLQKGAITVPSIAVRRRADGLFVYIVKPDGAAAVQPVKIGQDDGQSVIVTEGLSEGTMVVVAGMSRLQDGTKVTATQAKPNS